MSGSTAQRLGQDSPALAGQTLTLDALVSRVERGQLAVGQDTTIYFDEAGMADTDRLEPAHRSRGASRIKARGDRRRRAAALDRRGRHVRAARADIAPSAELSNIRRTLDPDEQRAWADLRAGRSDRAMAHYLRRGQLHMEDTRDEAVEQAAQNWAALTETHDPSEVALISDASNQEINRLNARAQHFRSERGELGDLEVPVPGVHYGIRQGDRVALIDQHHEPGVERIENGSRGEVLDITQAGEVLVEFDVTGRKRTFAGDDLGRAAPRLRPAHPPRPGRDRHPHPRRHRRLADQQGARLRRGVPRPPGHRVVRLPRGPRRRRARHRPHPAARAEHAPQPRADAIARAPRAA